MEVILSDPEQALVFLKDEGGLIIWRYYLQKVY